MTALILISIITLAYAAVAAADRPSIQTRTARTIVATWQCQDKIPQPRSRAYSPWKPHSAGFRQAELHRWQDRWRRCTYVLRERARQWNYTAWMPRHWIDLAACESGSSPPNWRHHTDYEGAFGFAPGSWDGYKLPGYPDSASDASPWQQWRVALRIAAHYHSIAGSWGCWRGPQHAWVRNGLPEHGTWQ